MKNTMATVANLWKRFSFIAVFAVILVVYVITIQMNGNRFNWGHISAILSSQNTDHRRDDGPWDGACHHHRADRPFHRLRVGALQRRDDYGF